MALDATKPADSDLISTVAAYLRATRTYINGLEAILNNAVAKTTLNLAAGATSMIEGSQLSDVPLEIVKLTASGAAAIEEITSGADLNMKIFILNDTNVTFVHDASKIRLNQSQGDPDFGGVQGDILALVNIGGSSGYWLEVFRAPRV